MTVPPPTAAEFRKHFTYDPNHPVTTEGWLSKAKMRFTGAHWQRRFFRLQGRCLHYFKKPGEPPCGYIPLLNIEIKEFQLKGKRNPLQFVLKVGRYIDQVAKIPKRLDYPLQAETDDSLKMWQDAFRARTARWIVGESLDLACSVTPNDPNARCLLPYFIPPFLHKMNQSVEIAKRGIWATEIPQNLLSLGLCALNLNLQLPLDDTQNAIGYVMAFLRSLPDPLLPPAELATATPAALRAVVLGLPAPQRQLTRELIKHFNRVLEFKAQNKANDPVFKFFEPVLAGTAPNADAVRKCLMTNADEIFEDVHQFAEAPSQPVLFRGRLNVNLPDDAGPDLLHGERGLIVSVVRQDAVGWCTVFTAGRRVGLVHETIIAKMTPEEEREIGDGAGEGLDSKMDVVREKVPDLVLLLEGMQAEMTALESTLAG